MRERKREGGRGRGREGGKEGGIAREPDILGVREDPVLKECWLARLGEREGGEVCHVPT